MPSSRVLIRALAHCSIPLAAYGGVCAAMAARVACEPGTGALLRALAPDEAAQAVCGLLAAAAALLSLPHLAAAAAARHWLLRRAALLLFALLSGAGVVGGTGAALWALQALDAATVQRASEALQELRDRALELLRALAKYHPLPHAVADTLTELEVDIRAAAWLLALAAALLMLLLLLGALLAIAALVQDVRQTQRHYELRSEESSLEEKPLTA